MLTLSERWFTTQTSVADRAATATGSIPTGTEPRCTSPVLVTSKISSRSSGVLTAKSRLPSGARASGRTWPLSKVTNVALAGVAMRIASTTAPSDNRGRGAIGMGHGGYAKVGATVNRKGASRPWSPPNGSLGGSTTRA